MIAASTGGSDPTAPTTFARAGIDCAPPAATEQVFLKVKATEYEIIAARLAIASVPGVTIDQYLDHQGAAAQLSCVFPDAPDLVHSIDPVDLPVSFAITADFDQTDRTAQLRALPNVRGVVTPETWNAWWTSIEAGSATRQPRANADLTLALVSRVGSAALASTSPRGPHSGLADRRSSGRVSVWPSRRSRW